MKPNVPTAVVREPLPMTAAPKSTRKGLHNNTTTATKHTNTNTITATTTTTTTNTNTNTGNTTIRIIIDNSDNNISRRGRASL